jgi:putative addiction module component (TIGR02574 family)
MSDTLKSLGIDRLPREERLILVQEIWDTIAAESHSPIVDEAQRQELARRADEDDASPNDVIPWEQVKVQALARTKKP